MLWYEQPARETEALPVGRIGAMVFGASRGSGFVNEDTFRGRPGDPVNPEAAGVAEVRRLIFADRWAEAEALANARLMARPIAQCRTRLSATS